MKKILMLSALLTAQIAMADEKVAVKMECPLDVDSYLGTYDMINSNGITITSGKHSMTKESVRIAALDNQEFVRYVLKSNETSNAYANITLYQDSKCNLFSYYWDNMGMPISAEELAAGNDANQLNDDDYWVPVKQSEGKLRYAYLSGRIDSIRHLVIFEKNSISFRVKERGFLLGLFPVPAIPVRYKFIKK